MFDITINTGLVIVKSVKKSINVYFPQKFTTGNQIRNDSSHYFNVLMSLVLLIHL